MTTRRRGRFAVPRVECGIAVYETVYNMLGWWDGPHTGVADYQGVPHLFRRDFDEAADEYAQTYALFRVEPLPEWVLRDVAGGMQVDTGIPDDAPVALHAYAEFRAADGSDWRGRGYNGCPLVVRWTPA
jgi:hypothetical protein